MCHQSIHFRLGPAQGCVAPDGPAADHTDRQYNNTGAGLVVERERERELHALASQ